MGAQLYQPTTEEGGVIATVDCFAGLPEDQSPGSLAVSWEGVMGKRSASRPATISDQLKKAIKASGRTAYAIGQQAGVDPGVITRFVNGERTLRLETVDRIAAALDLRLCGGVLDA
jgi:Helix-turn-helix